MYLYNEISFFMSNSAKAIAERLLQVEAVRLNLDEPFTWASGWKSPVYCDNRRVLSFPIARDLIKSEMCRFIFEEYPDTDAIAGVATAGIAWGAMVADQLKMPFLYVRSKPKEHGMGNQIEGVLQKNSKVVVIEDLVSTGMSSLAICETIRNAGAHVSAMISIFSYGFDVSQKAFEDAGIPMHSLTNYDVLSRLAIEKGIIGNQHLDSLLKWRTDPGNWGK